MNAAQVMTRQPVTADPTMSARDIAKLLLERQISAVPVVDDDGALVGIVSRANLLHGVVARQTGVPSIDDRKIKATVEKNLSDAGVRIQLLNLVVSSGVVHIWGVVATPKEQVAARVAAECALGVKEVRANIQILPFYMRTFIRAS